MYAEFGASIDAWFKVRAANSNIIQGRFREIISAFTKFLIGRLSTIMFNLKVKLLLATAVLILGGFSASNAQIADGTSIKVSVPKAFTLKDESFEAGIYTIERTPTTADSPSLLIIRGENGPAMIFDTVVARTNRAAGSTQLVFETVGDTTFLTAIMVKGQTARSEITQTKAQARKIAEGSVARLFLTINEASF